MDNRVGDILALGRPDRTTDRVRIAVQYSVDAADEFGDACVDSCHLLHGLYLEGSGVAANVLSNLKLSQTQLRDVLFNRDRVVCCSPLAIDDDVSTVMTAALAANAQMNHRYIGTEHILLGVVADGTKSATLLTELGLKLEDVAREVFGLMGHLP